jgi:hypothetical protein
MPREWIDRGTLLREYWKKQKSKQMTKLELKASADAAWATARAADAAWATARAVEAACEAAWATARAVEAACEAAAVATHLDWVVAGNAYQAGLIKTQEENSND